MTLYAPDPELYYAACARIDAVEGEIERLRTREAAKDEAAEDFCKVLKRGCDRLRSLANQALADWQAGVKDKDAIHSSLAFITGSAAKVGESLSILISRETDRGIPAISLPLIQVLDEVLKKKQKHQLLFFGTNDFNFYYRDLYTDVLKEPLFLSSPKDVAKFRQGLPTRFALVEYSAIERRNVLTLAILVHELAHYIDRVMHLQERAPKPSFTKGLIATWTAEARALEYVPDDLALRYGGSGNVPKDQLDFALRFKLVSLLQGASIWVRELLADMIATRILGIGFYLTQRKFLGFFPGDDQLVYPPHYRRYAAIATELLDPQEGIESGLDIRPFAKPGSPRNRALGRIVKDIESHYSMIGKPHTAQVPAPNKSSPNSEKERYLRLLARDVIEAAIKKPMKAIRERVRKEIPTTGATRLSKRVLSVADLLSQRIAPSQDIISAANDPPAQFDLREIINGTWLAWAEEGTTPQPPEHWIKTTEDISKLALRGIELSHFLERQWTSRAVEQAQLVKGFSILKPGKPPRGRAVPGGVLRQSDLVHRLRSSKDAYRLAISPVIDAAQIGQSSIDLRLGNAFIVVSRTRTESFEVRESKTKVPKGYYESHELGPNDDFVLHPGEFVLGSTLEYVSMPRDVMAYVIGRSTIGRLGLVIATATHVAAGYKGTLTLELTNVGTVPIKLAPGVQVAQLVFHQLTGPVAAGYASIGRYRYSVGPEAPRL